MRDGIMSGSTEGSDRTGGPPAILEHLRSFAGEFEERFRELLKPAGDVPSTLRAAMVYTALAPGKRVRPYLVARCCDLVGGSRGKVWAPAAAVECIHSFSLIHDDLPAMDDDDLRRGRPTCHREFGEAVAILAGDALSILAFELLGAADFESATKARMVHVLATCAGWYGMIGGQTADVLGESQPPSLEMARYIHARKTAALFEASCRIGALAGGAERADEDRLGTFGRLFGEAFQIADDLLDLTATTETMGKRVGKDASAGKQTFPRCVGMDRSRKAALERADEASDLLALYGEAASDLRQLARYAADRNY